MRLIEKMTAALVATAAFFTYSELPAKAFTITQNNDGSQLLQKLLGTTKGLSNFSVNLIGDGRAFGTFQDDPFGLNSGIVLSTGKVSDIVGTNTVDGGFNPTGANDLSTDFGLTGSPDDSITMEIGFDVDSTADKLFFQYVFGSEELLEYAGKFNDAFSLKLNGSNLAKLSDGSEVNINNLASTPLGPYNPDLIQNPVGTGPASNVTKLDGYTKTLTFEGLLNKNAKNTLTINIQDARDGLFDSAVFIKGGTLGTTDPSDGGSKKVTEPTSIFALLLFGGFVTVQMLGHKKHFDSLR